jgi:hypothetical protein
MVVFSIGEMAVAGAIGNLVGQSFLPVRDRFQQFVKFIR